MKTIAIKLPDDLLNEIHHAAQKRGETRSAVMREALEDFFVRERRKKRVPASTWPEILRDVCRGRRIYRLTQRTRSKLRP